jgi:hypothetical protein
MVRTRIGSASIHRRRGESQFARRTAIERQQEPIMKLNTTRAVWLGATAAVLIAATAGAAAADNAAPTTPATTTTQPSQQQTGVTAPTQQPSATSAPASATTTNSTPTRVWIKRSERGTNTHARGQSN